ncbi:MAG: polynucleotide adenylyltransferase PcnB [Rhodocyclaceae bacterium]|jgi:poly(A) polymerase|nr:polynucleotide adenylyltransferase PcnB [Rhodocyclaceae bacterium]MCE2979819.1 polynucleotide adenylyltransferase PcnB [Betaproteobacteria bacterium]MCA3073451.1 polynucleotide adenylyltransferase PcnB [Rhodocyclaceae bacterium]MCA3089510.1 polynucleotide adenylyltransferase PcnB [Rhodocyclaceae bacterium]MCA3093071.1 polynucleotide adenylyltransferase PcnB [Rhodocyclaceae bacterium]
MIRSFLRRVFGSRGARPEVRKVPQIIPRDRHGIGRDRISACALRVTSTLQDNGYKAFVVGGAVRDLLIGRKPKDFDVATDATPEQAAALFRRSRIIGRRFRLVHVMCGQELVETATFRGDGSPPGEADLDATADDAGDAFEAPEPPPSRGPRSSRPRPESGPGTRQADQHGRLIRDNVFGTQQQDAARRDFTVNALFYDPRAEEIVDYHHGVEDLRKRQIRMIGDPATRYREDPVRMLRAVRFAASIGFEIEASTGAPIRELAPLLSNVPPARLFDEMLKLLLSGGAVACVNRLRHDGLHHGLMPMLDVILEQPMGEKFVMLALGNTDARINSGKSVSPAFLFASLLWHEVLAAWKRGTDGPPAGRGKPPMIALAEAMDSVISRQVEQLAIPRRFTAQMREIWFLQPRFEQRFGRRPFRLLEQERFRSGYDFLLLRCESGELDAEVGEWWTRFQRAGEAEREEMLLPETSAGKPKRRRSRSGRGRSRAEEAGSPDGAGPVPAGGGAGGD